MRVILDLSVIEAVEQRCTHTKLDCLPTPEELEAALDTLKSEKSEGKNGLAPKVVKGGSGVS